MRLLKSGLFALVTMLFYGIIGLTQSSLAKAADDYFRSPVNFSTNRFGYEWLQNTGSVYGCSSGSVYHPGVDLNHPDTIGDADKGEPLYAIADGEVVYANDSYWVSLIIKFPFAGKDYYAVYGHSEIDSGSSDVVAFEIDKRRADPTYRAPTFTNPYVGMRVKRGQVVGLLWDHNTDAAHLHFEIRSSDHPNPIGTDFCGYYGGKSKSEMSRLNRDPLGFIVSNGYIDGTCRLVDPRWSVGMLCWTSNPVGEYVSCGQGGHHTQYTVSAHRVLWIFSGLSPDAVMDYCGHLSQDVVDIRSYLGRVEATGGGDEGGWSGAGYIVGAIEEFSPDPPDFIVKKTWLTTPWGTEVYKYGLQEAFDTKAQSENIGDGTCPIKDGEPTTITGHFYLSKGYKEDPHSGDGAWRRIDSTTTQCDNLKPGETNTETKNTVVSQWITTPGIYNIVYCIDHPLDDHNNGGEHGEKHESNNCSTEAVFEVTANQVENVPDVDLTVSGFTVLQSPVYAGDYIRLGAWVTNAGTVNATADIRSSYTVSCNGGPTSVLTDDGTMASTLTAGASAWEEILTPVQMPNVVGTCTLTFTADYLGAQPETDETNNSTSLTVTLAPRPAPVLSITRFEDKVGCCTTNTGAAPKPRIWVYNGGTAAPGANVTVVYQVSNPVATGGLYQVIGYGTIEPRELPPGTSDEDQMDCDGCWRIPTTSAWKKQWHNFRACLRVDGGTPVPSTGAPSPGEVCAVYQRYSKS